MPQIARASICALHSALADLCASSYLPLLLQVCCCSLSFPMMI